MDYLQNSFQGGVLIFLFISCYEDQNYRLWHSYNDEFLASLWTQELEHTVDPGLAIANLVFSNSWLS